MNLSTISYIPRTSTSRNVILPYHCPYYLHPQHHLLHASHQQHIIHPTHSGPWLCMPPLEISRLLLLPSLDLTFPEYWSDIRLHCFTYLTLSTLTLGINSCFIIWYVVDSPPWHFPGLITYVGSLITSLTKCILIILLPWSPTLPFLRVSFKPGIFTSSIASYSAHANTHTLQIIQDNTYLSSSITKVFLLYGSSYPHSRVTLPRRSKIQTLNPQGSWTSSTRCLWTALGAAIGILVPYCRLYWRPHYTEFSLIGAFQDIKARRWPAFHVSEARLVPSSLTSQYRRPLPMTIRPLASRELE